ncbi:MAG: class I SAM-dependent methyltransferase [Actinomycetota bacterium]|nr:class I SAM-dependent methyltransferase [Actinomycetota bacterium]
MEGFRAETYGDRIAEFYDRRYGGLPDLEAAVHLLAEVAEGGPALELGIGTGRIALPLAERGIEVHGIDASQAMVAKLREKPGGEGLPVTIGNFADVGVEGAFPLVFVAFNTFFALLSQEDQLRCFRNVAVHLTSGGRFVIRAFMPDLTRFTRDQSITVNRVELDEVELDLSHHDPVGQQITSQHLVIDQQGVRLFPVALRYAWPSELDLMARLAGLRLEHRWGGWRRQPFAASSGSHVSLYIRDPVGQ